VAAAALGEWAPVSHVASFPFHEEALCAAADDALLFVATQRHLLAFGLRHDGAPPAVEEHSPALLWHSASPPASQLVAMPDTLLVLPEGEPALFLASRDVAPSAVDTDTTSPRSPRADDDKGDATSQLSATPAATRVARGGTEDEAEFELRHAKKKPAVDVAPATPRARDPGLPRAPAFLALLRRGGAALCLTLLREAGVPLSPSPYPAPAVVRPSSPSFERRQRDFVVACEAHALVEATLSAALRALRVASPSPSPRLLTESLELRALRQLLALSFGALGDFRFELARSRAAALRDAAEAARRDGGGSGGGVGEDEAERSESWAELVRALDQAAELYARSDRSPKDVMLRLRALAAEARGDAQGEFVGAASRSGSSEIAAVAAAADEALTHYLSCALESPAPRTQELTQADADFAVDVLEHFARCAADRFALVLMQTSLFWAPFEQRHIERVLRALNSVSALAAGDGGAEQSVNELARIVVLLQWPLAASAERRRALQALGADRFEEFLCVNPRLFTAWAHRDALVAFLLAEAPASLCAILARLASDRRVPLDSALAMLAGESSPTAEAARSRLKRELDMLLRCVAGEHAVRRSDAVSTQMVTALAQRLLRPEARSLPLDALRLDGLVPWLAPLAHLRAAGSGNIVADPSLASGGATRGTPHAASALLELLCSELPRDSHAVFAALRNAPHGLSDEEAVALELLLLPAVGRLGEAVGLAVARAPALAFDFARAHCHSQAQWRVVLDALHEAMRRSAQSSSSGNEGDEAAAQLRTTYVRVLEHLVGVLHPRELVELLPEDGNVAFFLPFLEVAFSVFIGQPRAQRELASLLAQFSARHERLDA
jgi:hypothetical protein